MTSNENQQKQNEQENQPKKDLAIPRPGLAMTGKGFEPQNIDEAWRFANALARTNMVPAHYRGKPDECLICLDLAARLQTNWLAVMQHTYDVKGRIGFEAKFVLALINRSGLFTDPLEYEVVGENATDEDYAVRAYAKRKSTGKVLYGPWISWKLVKAEGWNKKEGSKWLTMPEQMFHYRAASWFKNRHCPEVTIGMFTTEELEDYPERKPIESMTYEETQEQHQQIVETQQGSEPVDADFENGAKDEQPEPEKAEDKPKKTKPKPKAKNKQKGPAYKCNSCGHECDEPTISGPKGNEVKICPKCLRAYPTDDKPDFMKDEEAA